MTDLVIASTNTHKIKEIEALLPRGFRILGLRETGFTGDIEETADTIRGNSLLKARAVREFLLSKGNGAAVIADDSGLEVKALGGRPGVHSARYAGLNVTDTDNVRKLLNEMEKVTDRHARFVTVITLLRGNESHYFEGEVKGTLAYEPRGANGFGYDPLFIPTGYRSTFAELPPEEKNKISHRAQAVAKLVVFLGNF